MTELSYTGLVTPTVLLAAVHTILGVVRAIEGLEGLGFSPLHRLPARQLSRVKAGVQVACGALHVAAALLLGGKH